MLDRQFVYAVLQAALGSERSIENTEAAVRNVLRSKIPGDLVECGVFAGAHPAVMARLLMDAGVTTRKVHLFDSFKGIPFPSKEDKGDVTKMLGPGRDGRLKSTGVSKCSIDTVRRNMNRLGINPALLVYHEGWFQKTMAAEAQSIDQIAVLRLDADLYESTKICLHQLYPKLSIGGWCIVDDYGLDGCRHAVDEYLSIIGEQPEIIKVPGEWSVVYWKKIAAGGLAATNEE